MRIIKNSGMNSKLAYVIAGILGVSIGEISFLGIWLAIRILVDPFMPMSACSGLPCTWGEWLIILFSGIFGGFVGGTVSYVSIQKLLRRKLKRDHWLKVALYGVAYLPILGFLSFALLALIILIYPLLNGTIFDPLKSYTSLIAFSIFLFAVIPGIGIGLSEFRNERRKNKIADNPKLIY